MANCMYVRMQLSSKDIPDVDEQKLKHLLFVIQTHPKFKHLQCSLAVGFSAKSDDGDTPPTGLFYCKTACVPATQNEDDFKTQPIIMMEIFSNDPATFADNNVQDLKHCVNESLLKDLHPKPRICVMNFSADIAKQTQSCQ